MRISLINPRPTSFWWKNFYFPSLGLLILEALTPPGFEVTIFDEANQKFVDFKEADLVGISVLTASARRAYEIADQYRQMGIPVVLGGVHVSALPEEAALHADSVVLGEADNIWPKLLKDFEAGKLEKRYQVEKYPSLQGLPQPRWELIDGPAYWPPQGNLYSVQATRGCPNSCNFCNVTRMFGRNFRTRPIPEVIKELESIPIPRITIIDDNILGHPGYAKELLTAMIPLEKRWVCQASLSKASEEDILKLLQASGCQYLHIGIETINPQNINFINKRINKTEEYRESIKRIHDHGIQIIGSFIIGLDFDDESVFEAILNFIQTNKIFLPIINILTPFPGTELFQKFQSENRILTHDWSRYNCKEVVFQPKSMTPEKLQSGHSMLLTETLKVFSGGRSYRGVNF